MHHIYILGFPNSMPGVSWKTYLPTFKDKKGDGVDLHMIRFHMHIHKFKVKFHEDFIMNMLMVCLEPYRIAIIKYTYNHHNRKTITINI